VSVVRPTTLVMFCLSCGKKFGGIPTIHRYCSDRCRLRFSCQKRRFKKLLRERYKSRRAWVARGRRAKIDPQFPWLDSPNTSLSDTGALQ